MIRTNNLWAPLVTAGRKPWIIWTCVRTTRRDAKAAYLEGFPESYHKEHLARIKFIKVFVAAHGIKEEDMTQEAQVIKWNCPCGNSYKFHGFTEAPQRTWVGLTDEERKTIAEANNMLVDDDLFDEIEAKLKEKNA